MFKKAPVWRFIGNAYGDSGCLGTTRNLGLTYI